MSDLVRVLNPDVQFPDCLGEAIPIEDARIKAVQASQGHENKPILIVAADAVQPDTSSMYHSAYRVLAEAHGTRMKTRPKYRPDIQVHPARCKTLINFGEWQGRPTSSMCYVIGV